MTTELMQAVRVLDSVMGDPSQGLPEEAFLLLSRMTPLVNVDLVIQDQTKKVAVHGVIECDRTVAGATGREERRERRQGPDGRSEGGEVPERRAWTESSKN